MLLVQNQFYCAGVRPHSVTAEWAPLTPPLRGVYEDRGAVSSLSTMLMAKSWRRYLAECLVETSFPKSCPRVRPVPSLRRILEAVREGRLTVQHEEEDAVPLHVAEALIRDDVWSSLLTVKSPFFGLVKRSPKRRELEEDPPSPSPIGTIRYAEEIARRGTEPAESLTGFYATLDELIQIKESMKILHRPWQPSIYAGQTHEWDQIADVFAAWQKIANAEFAAEKARNRK